MRSPRQGGGKHSGAILIDGSGSPQAKIQWHEEQADTRRQVDALILEERIAVGQLINIQVKVGFDGCTGVDRNQVAILILEGQVLTDLPGCVLC